MSIKWKVLTPLIATLSLLAVALSWFMLRDARRIAERQIQQVIEGKHASLGSGIDQAAEEALKHACLFSQLPEVLAIYGELRGLPIDDPADPQVQRQRQRLRAVLQPSLAGVAAVVGDDGYKLHFHLPNSRSLLRAWRATNQLNGSDLSDDISGFRPTVVEVNRSPHPLLKGIEVGRGGFAIRGLAPVAAAGGEHLGSVEMLADFKCVTAGLKTSEDQQLAIIMDARLPDVATSLAPDPAAP